ncbi:peroxidase family protein [Lyngbya confervoides]|uniref:Peroxidase n=1 Tax=Lyngbya confervoides BDU141951 TaxID=1574623 RepID=A0ABD4T6T0_9CYAN|nr:peroxidase family protein [Lyngbya confervoides]MCM1984180.1 hypothetical protein [Lyngbya confervoides BDU141951]
MPNRLLAFDPFAEGPLLSHSLDGQNNNLEQPQWGSRDSQILNLAPLDYGDGIATPAGSDRPGARDISNQVAQQDQPRPDPRGLTNLVWAMGQFLDHDLDLTPGQSNAEGGAETFDIRVPVGDPYLDPQGQGNQWIRFHRSEFLAGTSTDLGNPRQIPNRVTAWIDGSNIYGSSPERLALLRSFRDGQMKVSAGNLLPLDLGQNNDNPGPSTQLFLAGDVRANENIVLSSMHTLLVREHNRLAAELQDIHSDWSEEQLFQRARQINIAQLQKIVFDDYIPLLLGRPLPEYRGYDPSVHPGISRTFSTAAFRFGHTMVSPEIARLDGQGAVIPEGNVNLAAAFFPNAEVLQTTGIEPVLRGSVSTLAQAVDNQVIHELRNLLFSFGGQLAAQDLMALNIQRGRDHGLADYNSVRAAFGLNRVANFAQMTQDLNQQEKLAQIYGSVDNIDAVVGLFAEDPVPGGSVGETIATVLQDQFTRLRNGDRFYYKNSLTPAEIKVIEGTSFADIIRRNTNSPIVQENVFTLQQSGTQSNDELRGGLGDDVILGYQGDDSLRGYFGNDRLYGHGGSDLIKGEEGDDTLMGGPGNDRLIGGSGNDYLAGNQGNDSLVAGSGNDILKGGMGRDSLMGQAGNDQLVGGADDDWLNGGGGNDRILGTSHSKAGRFEHDVLIGQGGKDKFMLGNPHTAFYAANGPQDFAAILDFQVGEDKLVLHGTAADYRTEQDSTTTLIYWEHRGQSELIAMVNTGISINSTTALFR